MSNTTINASPETHTLMDGIGKYRNLKLIDHGGSAQIYKAFDPELERYVALKLLSPRLNANADTREQFFREIKTQAQLNIPGIARVFDCGESPHGLYYTMELIKGESLDKYCWNHPLAITEKLKFIGKIAGITAELHRQGLIHRDIKPGNIMIDEYGQVILLDLGLVMLLNEELSTSGDFRISGSPGYMPPEAFESGKANSFTTAADVYALAVLTFEIICGSLPYDVEFLSLGELAEVIATEDPKSMKAMYNETVPPELEKLVTRGLNRNPANRPSASEFQNIINSCTVTLETPVESIPKTGTGNLTRFAAIIVVLAIAAGIIYYLLEIKPKQPAPSPPRKTGIIERKSQEPAKPEPKEAAPTYRKPRIIKKTFFRNSAPDGMKSQWKSVKQDLATDPAFKNSGALCYQLPEKCTMIIKRKTDVITTVDSRLQQSGNFYRKSGDIITIELKRNEWDKPIIIMWTPKTGNADTLRPSSTIFEPTENSHE